jgi:transglycosylase-like protein with SLT domain
MRSLARPERRKRRERLLAAAVGGLLSVGPLLGIGGGTQAATAAPLPVETLLSQEAGQPEDLSEVAVAGRQESGRHHHHRHHHHRRHHHRHHHRRHHHRRHHHHHRHHHRWHHHHWHHHYSRALHRARSRAIARRMIHSPRQFSCFSSVIRRESDWNPRARNRSGAYGLPQALPGRKMASAGVDWRTNPRTQIRWAIRYMHSSYGSPCGAWTFWRHHHWY